MKEWRILVAGVAFGLLIGACNPDKRCINGEGDYTSRVYDIKNFHSLAISGDEIVEVYQSKDFRLEILAQSNVHERVELDVRSGVLDVHTSGCLRDHLPVKVMVGMPELNGLELSGSGSITIKDTFYTPQCRLSVSGSGYIDHLAYLTQLTALISGSGEIYTHGACSSQAIDISGSGNYKGLNFQSIGSDVDISGSGSATLWVENYLDVNISGSGNVYYQGDPSSVIINVSGSGQVVKL